MHHGKQISAILVIAALFSTIACCSLFYFQPKIQNADLLPDTQGPYVVENIEWDPATKNCSFSLRVPNVNDCSIAIVKSSSTPFTYNIQGAQGEFLQNHDVRQISIITLFDKGATGYGTVSVTLYTERWDSADKVYVGSDDEILSTFFTDFRAMRTVVLTSLFIIFAYAFSLYLSKPNESYLKPFVAYTALLLAIIAVSAFGSASISFVASDFLQVCSHFYVAYIPLALCILLSGVPVSSRMALFVNWKGLLSIPLFLGVAGYFVGLGPTMFTLLTACMIFGCTALSKSIKRNTPWAWVLALGFSFTIGMKVAALLVDCGLVPDSITFLLMRKTRLLNLPILFATMLFLNRKFSLNFKETEAVNERLDIRVKERTSELVRQQELRLGMMTNIFHDLRTPLFCTKSLIDSLSSDTPIDDKMLATLKERLGILSVLIDDLFTAAKLEDNDLLLADDPVSIDPIVTNAIKGFEPLIQDKRIAIKIDSLECCQTWGDRIYLTRAIENIIANAIQHTPHSGFIELSLKAHGSKLTLHVFNSGKGIEEEDLDKIFERYYRRGKTADSGKSSGLGLSIAKSIIEKHRGSISVMNYPNEGCAFLIHLPQLTNDD